MADGAFQESFEGFYAREQYAVVGLAYVLSGSRLGAEDLAQDAFLAAYRNWDKIQGYDQPGAWVRRVVANRAVSAFRSRSAEARALLKMSASRTVVTIPDLDFEAEMLWAAVRRLPRRQAQTISLRYLDGSSIAEIARILDCSEATVKTHLQRAKAALARHFEAEEAP